VATSRTTLRTRVRLELGEAYASGESAITTGRYRDAEINTWIDEGLEQVSQDAITTDGYALIRKVVHYQAVLGKSAWELPADLMEVLKVEIVSGNTPYFIDQVADLASMLDGVDETTSSSLPHGWQLQERGRFEITHGIATGGSATTLIDTDRDDGTAQDFETGADVVDDLGNALAVGDIIVNETAGFEVAIAAITDTETLTFATYTEAGGPRGGSRHTTEFGDKYSIQGIERTRNVLRLNYPFSATDADEHLSNATSTNTGTCILGTNSGGTNVLQGQTFIPIEDGLIASVAVKFGALTGTVYGNVVLSLEGNSSGPNDVLVVEPFAKASIKASSISQNGFNIFVFKLPVPVIKTNTYTFKLEMPIQTNYVAGATSAYFSLVTDEAAGYSNGTRYEHTGSWADGSDDLLFKINYYRTKESLRVQYASRGRKLAADTDALDIPRFAEEALVKWVVSKAVLKGGATNAAARRASAEARQEYNTAIESVRTEMRRQRVNTYGRVSDAYESSSSIANRTAGAPNWNLPLSWRGN
jgi:hypothetical protein